MAITWAYSPSWISANFMPEYSTRKPAISSDSASRMSKGTRFSAASVATMYRRNASVPSGNHAANQRPAWAAAMSESRSDPASSTGTSATKMKGRS